jgi:DNA-binding XRE family transcriptional regulator
MKVTKNLFGKVMKTQRILMKLTHQQLYEATGISKKIISNIEKGRTRASEINEQKLIACLWLLIEQYYLACMNEMKKITATIKINYPHYSELNGTENE